MMQQSLVGFPGVASLKQHWWAFLIRGIVAVAFGVLCFAETGATLFALVTLIGAFFIVDGVFVLVGAVRSSSASTPGHWWMLIVGGIFGIAAGALTFVWPGLTAYTLALFIAAWAMITGIFELITAIRMRHTLWLLNGILSIILGALIAVNPAAGLNAITWILGFYSLLAGFTMIGLSVRLRNLKAPAV